MREILLAFLVALFALVPETSTKEVSNADIQGAILTLVHSFNVIDNKLERHEHRERALGEVVKRALQAIQKGQKVYEPIKGIFSRLDERVSQIETMLIAQEEKYNAQTDKLTDTIETMYKWMSTHAACDKNSPPGSTDQQTKLIEKIEKLAENIDRLAKSSEGLHFETEKLINSKVSSTDDVISKMDAKLSHFYITGPISTPAPLSNPDFETKMISYLDKIYEKVGDLKNNQKIDVKLSTADKNFIEGLYNDTLKSIGNIRQEVISTSEKAQEDTKTSLKVISGDLQSDISKIAKELSDSNAAVGGFYSDVNNSIATLHDELDVFNKFDKVLLGTSDYVLDTQRKVEYGTHQVIMKIGDLIKTQSSDLNSTIQRRLNDLDDSVISNHKESLQNLSSIMESELAHVWRQIEVMHAQITNSKEALDKLQGQTELYVNGTVSTMDSMGGKVAQITGRMAEVDENLNYLLGRLSLVTQEFNQIKSGLGSALDQIRSSFQTVQDKIKDVGPGPHPITGEAEAK